MGGIMKHINITELRQHLPSYLSSVQKGEEICVTSHGRVIARVLPPVDHREIASKKLEKLRKQSCVIGDVISPIDDVWDAQS